MERVSPAAFHFIFGDAPDPENRYVIDIEYAQRLTWGGEFIHAAPWSVGSQGSANVSHGCVGMSTADAGWLYSRDSQLILRHPGGTARRSFAWRRPGPSPRASTIAMRT